ncbi:hypothetical protein [Yersinia sp. Marseille-Q3913]|uniref:hypothetical protein n=1 Tax=Yersinia sp. Marseille-Q3913 TaxID=2830769 RepID=UPI001BB04BD8|nr:hypothetical protein [Yersinia sp. Marseille-Q3913]MBS0057724.1 hypothetical protein [Yersinia sp. Marseille-Q3913]
MPTAVLMGGFFARQSVDVGIEPASTENSTLAAGIARAASTVATDSGNVKETWLH